MLDIDGIMRYNPLGVKEEYHGIKKLQKKVD